MSDAIKVNTDLKQSLTAIALSLLLGVCSLQLQPDLLVPLWSSAELLQFLPLCLFLFYWSPPRRAVVSFFIGYLWALLFALNYLQHALPVELVSKDILVQGVVSGVVEVRGDSTRFNFDVSHFGLDKTSSLTPAENHMPSRLRLSWYYQNQEIRSGDRWQLMLRLKQPHGMQNPGGFDYEKWLYQKGIHAVGYIRKSDKNSQLSEPGQIQLFSVDHHRQSLINLISELPRQDFQGILQALTVGHKALINTHQWQVLRKTGTSHLMAISGLHIGLVAGMVFWLVRRLTPVLLLKYISAPQLAAIFSLLVAFFYALLAGFSVPTQRAFIMLLVVMLAILLKRPAFSLNTLALSLIAVLLVNPVSVLSVGFWLSYLAVLIITLVSAARIYGESSRLGNWLKTVRVQWLIALGMLPVSFILFQQGSLISPLANMLVIPVVALLVVPIALFASVLGLVSTEASLWMFAQAGELLALVWMVLEWLAQTELASLHRPGFPLLHSFLAICGVALVFMPRGFPLRFAGLLMILPLLLYQTEKPRRDEFWLTLLDVGQGLSVLIQTRDKVLLYDTGAKLGERFDIGQRVVLPFLHYRGIEKLDRLIISHGDNDHAGGARSILESMPVEQLLQGETVIKADEFPRLAISACRAGQYWNWAGVNFEILHPGFSRPENHRPEKNYRKSNNRSCVLKVWNAQHSVIIAGDIERKVELELVASHGEQLAAEVLIVPHHGSNTSSSQAWLDKIKPRLAMVSAGYKNRFKHPTAKIRERYLKMGTELRNSARQGAMQIKFNSAEVAASRSKTPSVVSQRKVEFHYWNHRF